MWDTTGTSTASRVSSFSPLWDSLWGQTEWISEIGFECAILHIYYLVLNYQMDEFEIWSTAIFRGEKTRGCYFFGYLVVAECSQ